MKKSLMAATAVAALIAGTALASAEEMKGGAAGQAPASQTNQGGHMNQSGQMHKGADSKAKPGMDSKSRADSRAQERSLKDPATKGAESAPVPGSRRSTTGQGTAEDRTPGRAQQDQQRSSQPQNTQREERNQNAQSPRDRSTAGDAGDRNNNQARNRGDHKPLSTEQKTKIRTTVINRGPKVSNVNFAISVGTVVPSSISVVAVPPTLVEYYPQWRGYRYFVVGDEIIIVEPRTLRIVAVLDV
jgi:hypothetical protein